jgi:uncharacterized membrane protein
MSFHEKNRRSWVKALTYRTLAFVSDTTVIYMFTGKVSSTLKLVIGINILNTINYFFHERIWDNVHWGKGEQYNHDDNYPANRDGKVYGSGKEDYE